MKAFTKILCLLLAMMMVLSLAACSKDDDGDKGDDNKKETIVGKWAGKLTDKTIEAMLGTKDVDIDTKLMVYFEFDKDGEGEMTIDKDNFKDFMEEYLEISLEKMAEQYGMTVEELLSTQRMTKEQYIEQQLQRVDSMQLDKAFTYEIDGDKLMLTDEDDKESVITFELDGDNLEMIEKNGDGGINEEMFPVTLERVK